MTFNTLALITALTLTSTGAFAADGAEMLDKRRQAFALERQDRQQAREQLVQQQKNQNDQAAADNHSPQRTSAKPAS